MKAIQFDAYGGPEVLHLAEVAPPEPGPGEIRVAVRAAGVNGIDGKIRSGFLKDFMPVTFPSGTGLDAAGVVERVGDEVEGVAPGDRVFGNGRSTLAELAVLTSWALMPDGLSFEQAAGYPLPAETAMRILRLSGVQPGETLLVNGASGGVGSAAVQIARHRGITVIGAASEANHDYLRSLGAIPITYGEGLGDRVRQVAASGVDAALDIGGPGAVIELIKHTGAPARVVSLVDFTAEALGAKVSHTAEDFTGALAEVADLVRRHEFAIPVASSFPLAEAGAAQAASNAGHVAGRIVVTVPLWTSRSSAVASAA